MINNLTQIDEKDIHWCRIAMNRQTTKLVESLDYKNMVAMEISGSMWLKFPFKQYGNIFYPQFDICDKPVLVRDGNSAKGFDIVIAEQVFEHLRYPHRAVKNVYTMVNSGGYFLLTVPFLIRVHGCPEDYTRWTEDGLRYLLHEGGFPLEHIQTGSWGNKDCIAANFYDWPYYDPEKHSLENEPDLPMMVWALAKKPG